MWNLHNTRLTTTITTTCFNNHFPGEPGLAWFPFGFLPLVPEENLWEWGLVCWLPLCYPTNSVTALNETQSTDPNPGKSPTIVVVIVCIYKPCMVSAWTATSSDNWSRCRPPTLQFGLRQQLTIWDNVYRLPCGHSVSCARQPCLWQDAQWPVFVHHWAPEERASAVPYTGSLMPVPCSIRYRWVHKISADQNWCYFVNSDASSQWERVSLLISNVHLCQSFVIMTTDDLKTVLPLAGLVLAYTCTNVSDKRFANLLLHLIFLKLSRISGWLINAITEVSVTEQGHCLFASAVVVIALLNCLVTQKKHLMLESKLFLITTYFNFY